MWMIDTLIPPAGPYSWVSFDGANLGLNLARGASASVTVKASAAGRGVALLHFSAHRYTLHVGYVCGGDVGTWRQ